MSVLKNFGQFCSTPGQPALRVFAERQIDACTPDFGVFWYRRPTGHTKTAARHHGETPMIIEWAFVLRAGDIWQIGAAVPGFSTRDEAIVAARKVRP